MQTASGSKSPSDQTGGSKEPRQAGGRGKAGGGGRGSPRGPARGSPHKNGTRSPWNSAKKQQQSPATPSSPQATAPLLIETNDFRAVHATCRASKYKVHRPGCDCPKMRALRARPLVDGPKTPQNLTDLMTNLNLSDRASQDRGPQDDPFDSLMVVPDTKGSAAALFACTATGKLNHSLDPNGCERTLQGKIFGQNPTGDPSQGLPPFKVSCAVCLLEDAPNGFVCMASSVPHGLDEILDRAREIANRKRSEPGGWHSDHAHYVCVLQVESLRQLCAQPNSKEIKQSVLLQLQSGGVQVNCISNGILTNDAAKVKLGHHLMALLEKIQKKKRNDKFLKSLTHWMVIGYKDGSDVWSLDLPGGKRHLGESTSECAIRETEEESSVHLDPTWITDGKSRQLHDGACNLFYVVEPPSLSE